MTVKYGEQRCDVLIIGAGGAGLRAAIEAYDSDASVIITSKSLPGKAHTVMAEGGIAAALGNVDPNDNWKIHFQDTIVEGQHLGNPRMVEIFTKEAIEIVYELEEYGALFDRTPDGRILQRPFGAHTYRRLCHIGDRTGLELIRTCQEQVLSRNIPIISELMITDLLLDDKNAVNGAVGLHIPTGEFTVFNAKAVILATGGCGKVYAVTSNSWESTGDGIGVAYRAGAQLMDMEMIQFHPTGMVHPPGAKGILVTEAVRGEGGILLNAQGDRFMSKYSPKRMELSARDVVARAIYQEITEGRGTSRNAVYLDITHKGASFIKQKLPSMYLQFKEFAGIDITKEKMEVAPTVHYQMGGVKVDPESTATNISGLYAAGEVSGGLHGANRLGGNSLSDILVFGRRAGNAAARHVKNRQFTPIDKDTVVRLIERVEEPVRRSNGENSFELRDLIQNTMQANVGIMRDEKGLETALVEIQELKRRARNIAAKENRIYNPAWTTAMDVDNMLTASEAIVRSALMRKESRGAHARRDYSQRDDEHWHVNIIIQQVDGQMTFNTSKVPSMPVELANLMVERK